MNIFSNEKIELEYDSYDKIYTLTLYDNYGHYVEGVRLEKEDVNDLYNSLKEHLG